MMEINSMDEVNAIEAVERPLQTLVQIANHHATNATFTDHISRKATNTIRAQRFDLAVLDYLTATRVTVDALMLWFAPSGIIML